MEDQKNAPQDAGREVNDAMQAATRTMKTGASNADELVSKLTERAEPKGTDEPPKPKLTFGQKLMGVSFNPSRNPMVDEVKMAFGKMVDDIQRQSGVAPYYSPKGELGRLAISQIILTQMAVVKVLTLDEDQFKPEGYREGPPSQDGGLIMHSSKS